jgi:hypothetical protein
VPGWLNELDSWITYQLIKPITNTAWVRAQLCKLQKGCTRLAAASDTVYQLLAHGRWFSPGTPASSTTKTGRHDIAEILLNVALNTKNQSIYCLTTSTWALSLLINGDDKVLPIPFLNLTNLVEIRIPKKFSVCSSS